MQIHMSRGGRAWRGYFPVGGELTSGQPDLKEGLYFGTELDDDDPRVRAGTPMHGRNLFPDVPQFRARVLDYMSALEAVGQQVLSLMAEGLQSRGRLFSASLHRRSDGALPDLPLSARRSCARRLGRRCAHRLWIAHAAAAGCGRRAAGPESRPLARRAAARGFARLQRRRHAGAADQRPLSLGTASREEPERTRAPVDGAVPRSCFRCEARTAARRDAATRTSRTRTCAGIASTRTRCRAPTASTCSAKSRRCFRNWRRPFANGRRSVPEDSSCYGFSWARISPALCAALCTLTYSSPAL